MCPYRSCLLLKAAMAPTEGPDMAQLAVEQPQGVEEEVFVPTGELARIAKEELGEDHQVRDNA